MYLKVFGNGSLGLSKSFYIDNLRLLFNATEINSLRMIKDDSTPLFNYAFITRRVYENYAGMLNFKIRYRLNVWGDKQMGAQQKIDIVENDDRATCRIYQYVDEKEILSSYILSFLLNNSVKKEVNTKLLVTDVPYPEYAPKLMESIDFSQFHSDAENGDLKICIHLTDDSVLMDPMYKDFMYRISQSNDSANPVKHFVINSSRFVPIYLSEYEKSVVYRKYFDVGIFHKLQMIEDKPECLDPIDCSPQKCHGVEYSKLYYKDCLDLHNGVNVKSKSKSKSKQNIISMFDWELKKEEVDPKMFTIERHCEEYLTKFNTEEIMEKAFQKSVFIEDIDSSKFVPNILANIDHNKYPKITFIGTGGSTGSGGRGRSCILIEIKPDVFIMLECGPGSLDRICTLFGTDRSNHIIRNLHLVYISHMHTDHYLGIYQLLKYKHQLGSTKPVNVIANQTILNFIFSLNDKFRDIKNIHGIVNRYSLLDSKQTRKLNAEQLSKLGLQIEPVNVWHCNGSTGLIMNFNGTIGYDKVEWKIAFSGDRKVNANDLFEKKASNCDLLIHEATYPQLSVDLAEANNHSTVLQAVECSKRVNARSTILTHIGPKHKVAIFYDFEMSFNPNLDASDFDNVYQAKDFITVNLDSIKYQKYFEDLLPIFYYREIQNLWRIRNNSMVRNVSK